MMSKRLHNRSNLTVHLSNKTSLISILLFFSLFITVDKKSEMKYFDWESIQWRPIIFVGCSTRKKKLCLDEIFCFLVEQWTWSMSSRFSFYREKRHQHVFLSLFSSKHLFGRVRLLSQRRESVDRYCGKSALNGWHYQQKKDEYKKRRCCKIGNHCLENNLNVL